MGGHQQTRIGQAFETGKETVQAWVEKLAQRMCETESAFEMLTTAEQEVNRNAEAQRRKINEEMDHMRDLIETKRQQLLSKSSLDSSLGGLVRSQQRARFPRSGVASHSGDEKTFSPGGRTCATAFGFQATPDRRAGEGSRRSRSRSAQTPA